MPRFRLLQAHQLQRQIGDTVQGVLVEAGTEIDSADYVGFAASPSMEPLDDAAYAQVLDACDRARRAALNTNEETPPFGPGSVVGCGVLARAPGGDLEGTEIPEI